MFYVRSSKKIFHANQLKIYDDEIPNSYPYVVRSARNNGVRGYICENKDYLNPANTLSFAQDTFMVFYQEKPYFTGNNVKILVPKFKPFNKICGLFFTSIYQKVLETFSWGINSTKDYIEQIVISLPVLPTKIEETISKENIEKAEDIKSSKENNNHLIIENTDSSILVGRTGRDMTICSI